jgi:signal transduction histidine kinase
MVIDTQPDEARTALEIIEATSRRALAEMRRLVGVLRTPDEPGVAELAPTPGLENLDTLLGETAHAGVDVDVDVSGGVRPLPEGVSLAAYRIIQEALTNVVRHAGPTHARLALVYGDDQLEVRVENEGGVGEEPADGNGSGHGLVGMRERAALYGGELVAGPTAHGYRVVARLPIDAAS